MTLVELIVAMGILMVLLVISMAAIMSMTRNTVRAQAVTNAADQLRVTFQQLDKEVRYASDINDPGSSSSAIYVEYLVAANAATGDAQCVQWRYVTDSGELQRRTWAPGSTTPSSWSTAVTRLRNDLTKPDQQPFVFVRAGNHDGKVYTSQQLKVFLDTGLGDARDVRGGQLDVTLVALNSSTASTTNGPAGTGSVCTTGGIGRP